MLPLSLVMSNHWIDLARAISASGARGSDEGLVRVKFHCAALVTNPSGASGRGDILVVIAEIGANIVGSCRPCFFPRCGMARLFFYWVKFVGLDPIGLSARGWIGLNLLN